VTSFFGIKVYVDLGENNCFLQSALKVLHPALLYTPFNSYLWFPFHNIILNITKPNRLQLKDNFHHEY